MGMRHIALATTSKRLGLKTSPEYDTQYTQWREASGRPRSALSIIDWCSKKLSELSLRSKEEYLNIAYSQPRLTTGAVSKTVPRTATGTKTSSSGSSKFPEKRAYNCAETAGEQEEEEEDWDSPQNISSMKTGTQYWPWPM